MKSLIELPEWQKFKHKNKEKILTYITTVYDHKSITKDKHELSQRKRDVLKKLKLEKDPEFIEISEMKNKEICNFIFLHLSNTQPTKFHIIIGKQQLLLNILKRMNQSMDDIDDDDLEKKIKLQSSWSTQAEEIADSIEVILRDMYPDEFHEQADKKIIKMITLEQRIKSKDKIQEQA